MSLPIIYSLKNKNPLSHKDAILQFKEELEKLILFEAQLEDGRRNALHMRAGLRSASKAKQDAILFIAEVVRNIIIED